MVAAALPVGERAQRGGETLGVEVPPVKAARPSGPEGHHGHGLFDGRKIAAGCRDREIGARWGGYVLVVAREHEG